MLTSRQYKQNTIEAIKHLSKLSESERLEAEQKKNILLLIENLIEREEATFKMIIDCLYDLGSVNLINKKFSICPFNQMMKLIAKFSRPGFRFIAFYWVHKNTPKLITNWLLKKVNRLR
ncbi:hypothetical protein RGRSB_1515 [cyanobacterium endosymbiont of Rhopalodia gibberula]|uniref:hypothetical protein n=1 Tax=cyanobacterium endosymbiont of Rhopalodia gibberula TaxID=1763363 RepID=UPI000DC6E2AC|nr:hypothetical protein [cyanobacterium endosymbiont of Rhopalodia gibberula]BBA79932.1 hypothetical protein RGRSB_1515 [cyanobacterium endosymbiont of Rhopalodia gibberula]